MTIGKISRELNLAVANGVHVQAAELCGDSLWMEVGLAFTFTMVNAVPWCTTHHEFHIMQAASWEAEKRSCSVVVVAGKRVCVTTSTAQKAMLTQDCIAGFCDWWWGWRGCKEANEGSNHGKNARNTRQHVLCCAGTDFVCSLCVLLQ